MKTIFLFLPTLLLTGCMADNLPKYNELNNLRILALVASSPEVDAGGSTTITPILSDITETTSLTYEATGCIPLTTADSACTGNATAATLQTGTLNTGDMVAARSFTGAATTVAVTVPTSVLIFNQRNTQDQYNGLSYLVTYTVHNSHGDSVQSFRRIIVSTRSNADKNHNPILSDVLANGTVLTTTLPAGQTLNLTPSFGAVAAESFPVQTDSGSYRTDQEEIVTSWFATDGHLKYYRSVSQDENPFTAPDTQPTGRDVLLIAVTRDGRGGMAYQRKCFGVCP